MSDGVLMLLLLGLPIGMGVLFLIRRLKARRDSGSGVGRIFRKRRL